MGSNELAAFRFMCKLRQVDDPLFDPKIGLRRHLESQLCQNFLQPVETAATDKADGSSRQTKLLRNLVIRDRRLLIEKQLHQLSAPRREPQDGVPDRLLLLH